MHERLELAQGVAREAGAILRRSLSDLEVETKGATELVTRVDYASQELIFGRIHERYRDDAFLGEEGEGQAGTDAPRLWVVDPLDGTNNYVHGIPQFCVSIAYAEEGVVRAGVVYDPTRDEMFAAASGGGAFLNGRPIRVSERERLDDIVVATGFYYDRDELMERTLDAMGRLFRRNVHGIRRFGSAALDLCWLACGRFDAYFEYRLSPWDFAAASLVAREAGGRLSDRSGAPLTLASSSMLAANPRVYDSFAAVVRLQSP